MRIKEAFIHDLLMQVTSGKITFSRACELINEEAAKPVSKEQSKINMKAMLRQCSNGLYSNYYAINKDSLNEYFEKGLNLKNYSEYDQI